MEEKAQERRNKAVIYGGSVVVVTTGMVIIKGVCSVVNWAVSHILGV